MVFDWDLGNRSWSGVAGERGKFVANLVYEDTPIPGKPFCDREEVVYLAKKKIHQQHPEISD